MVGFWVAIVFLLAACTAHVVTDSAPPNGDVPEATTPTPVRDSTLVEAAAARFLDQRSTGNATATIDAIAANGDERWVPWLIDLLRLGLSNRLGAHLGDILADLTGEPATGERVGDLIRFGAWSQNRDQTGGRGYRDWKVALYGGIDDEFAPLLASVGSDADLAAIQWGGVPRGGIPELNDPTRDPAPTTATMTPDEIVLGVVIDDIAVAYPLRIMARHELANDTIAGVPVAVVYCTLCQSGLVFDRRVDGELLDFQTSGLLLNSNKIMVDVQTDTVWHHLRGTGIGGRFAGTELTQYPVDIARWSDWLADHPGGEVIIAPAPIFFDDPERPPIAYDYTPGEAYRSYYENPDVWFPVLDTPDDLALKAPVLGIEHDGASLALPVAELTRRTAFDVEVGGAEFRIEPNEVSARVFDAEGNRVIVEQSFWFAWYANHPTTTIWSPQ